MRYSKRRKNIASKVVNQSEHAFLSFDKALNTYLQALEAANRSRETIKDYKAIIRIFLHYMREEHEYTSLHQIKEADILGWLAHLRNSLNQYKRPYSSRTIATYNRGVLIFFRWLVKHQYLSFDPTTEIEETKVEKTLIRVFTEDELAKLDTACNRAPHGRSLTPDERKMLAARDRAVLWLLLSTGIRLSELCGLRFCDIDWDKSMIYVRGKGAKERKVPMGAVARQHLNTYITYWRGAPSDIEEIVFLTVFGKPVVPSSVKSLFARLKSLSGIEDKRVSAHTCRHWFAVNCIKNGMPTIAVKDMLGHESWKMIEVYVKLAEQDRTELYAKFSPVDGLDIHHSTSDKRQRVREWRNSRKRSTKN